MLVAVFLRFANIQNQGAFAYDEAWYMNIAKTYLLLPKFLSSVLSGTDPKVAFEQVYSWGFFPQITYKPSYIVLLMLTQLVVGFNNPAAGPVLSAVLGLLTIVVIYLTALRLFANRWIALVASAITAISGFQVYYSRFGLPYQLPALALLTYLYCYVQYRLGRPSTKKTLFWFGLGVGLIQTTNDMMIPMVGLLTLFEGFYFLYQNQWKLARLPGLLPFIGGVALPIVFWDLLSHGLRKIFHWTLHKGYVEPYHQELFGHIFSSHVRRAITNDEVYGRSDYLYFVKSVLDTEGWPFLCLLGVGVVFLAVQVAKSKKSEWLFLALLSGVSLLLLFLYPEKRFRLAAPFFPLLILVATVGLNALLIPLQKPLFRAVAVCLLLIAVTIPALQFSYGFTQLSSSGYQQVADYLRSRLKPGEPIATPFRFPIYALYFPDRKVFRFHSTDELKEILTENPTIRYIMFEETQYNHLCAPPANICHFRKNAWHRVGIIEDWLAPYRVATFNLPYTVKTPVLWETMHVPYESVKTVRNHRHLYNTDKLRVYYIPQSQQLIKTLPGQKQP